MRKKVHVLWHEIKRLKSKEPRRSLRWHVLNYVQQWYKTDEDVQCFFRQLSKWGCASGAVCHLIYYRDTRKFFDRFYEKIEELREEWEFSVGEPWKIQGDLKTCLARFGFEQIADQIANELNIEV